MEAGAKEVYLSITHPILAGPAMERLKSDSITGVITTNTVSINESQNPGGRVESLSIRPLLAKVITIIHLNRSVSQLFREEHIVFPA